MAMTPPFSMEAYVLPDCLWRLVEENVAPGERQEIRDVLGNSMVEQSLELRTEVEALLEIWRDYRQDTETVAAPVVVLPEPPLLRKSLKGQIRILVESLKERAKDEGRDSGLSLSRQNSEVLDYVLNDSPRDCGTPASLRRPSSAFSIWDGHDTPMRMTPSGDSDELSTTSTISDQVDSVKDQLTVLQIDEVVQDLRSALEDEVNQLLQDISFLQGCLEEESDFRVSSRMMMYQQEPSIQELRAEKSILEKQLQEASSMNTINIINSVRPKTSGLPSPKKLPSPVVPSSKSSSKLRPSPPPSASSGTRQGPSKVPQPTGKGRLTAGAVNTSRATRPGGEGERQGNTTSPSVKPTTETMATTMKTSSKPQRKPPIQSPPHSPISRMLPSALRDPSSPPPLNLRPSPPSSARPPPGRPSSAQRLRTRVLEARQGKT